MADNPRDYTIREWLSISGGRRSTSWTYNGVTYTDWNEIEWREANDDWLPAGQSPTSD